MKSKVVLITGASSGIGLATADLLHDAGFIVYGTSRRASNAFQYKFHLIELDVNNDDSVNHAIEKVLQNEGQIDVLINNAGFAIAPAGAEESSMQQAQAIFDTNFFGAVRMTRAVLPIMRQQKAGLILNISSVLGLLPMPFGALYSASKHALEGYSESLDHELRMQGIRVSLIEPAYTKTSLGINLLEADAKISAYEHSREKLHQQMIKSINKSDDPSVVAKTILKVINSSQILPRYTAGKTAKLLKNIRRFAPVNLFDTLIQRSLKV
ncbi:SDR family NAD(P)-dependent oxidoreductase [Acinetobacter sp. ANC 4779]|uniref:oxidoreductase n=1 Tax=Acinetobacter sp. ANC 4779 TaxID=2529848 RepID=UPI00103A2AAF|nr:oxidoreductase [Acinetobacter sp. ANC 4779]TCB47642.1 SDR family NAD(P)-dependent oxidoreductase [Acinetobacter sp. ANC 4779]